MTTPRIGEKEELDLAWMYFQQHASQRVSFFNFFIVLATSLTAVLVTAVFQFRVLLLGAAVGLMLSFTSFVFWKIDQRNKHLTKMGENALRELESCFPLPASGSAMPKHPHPIQVFTHEAWRTTCTRQEERDEPMWKREFSFSKSLNLLFLVYGSVGLLGAGTSVFLGLRS